MNLINRGTTRADLGMRRHGPVSKAGNPLELSQVIREDL